MVSTGFITLTKKIVLPVISLEKKRLCQNACYIHLKMYVCCSLTPSCATLCNPMDCSMRASLSFIISRNLLKLMSVDSVMPSNNLILCHPLLLLPSGFPSISIFSSESALCIRWPDYWSFSLTPSPSKEYSEFISFRIDWFDPLAFQRTLKNLFQHHSSKTSNLWHSAFFMVQHSHPYLTTEKTIALTIWIFVCKVMSLLFF